MASRFYHRKSSSLSSAGLSDAAEFVLKFLEDSLSGSKKEMLKNSKEASLVLVHYLKKHPYVLASSSLVAGGMIAYILSKCQHAHCPHHHNHYQNGSSNNAKEDVGSQLEHMVKSILDDLKIHSSEICDSVISNYMRKKPLQTTGAALIASLIMSLLSRR